MLWDVMDVGEFVTVRYGIKEQQQRTKKQHVVHGYLYWRVTKSYRPKRSCIQTLQYLYAAQCARQAPPHVRATH